MITWINHLSNILVDPLMRPFQLTSPWPGLLAASLLVAVLALLLFKWRSNQRALRRQREQVLARLLELHLFRDDLPGIFGAFGRILVGIVLYLQETSKPVAILLLPTALFVVQLAAWFQYRSLREHEAAVVTVKFDDRVELADLSVDLAASPEISVETAGLVSADDHEVLWRIRPRATDPQGWVAVAMDGQTLRKTVGCGADHLVKVSAARVRDGWWERLTNPGEPPLPADTSVRSIRVDYPPRAIYLGNLSINWAVALFVLSFCWGLVLQSPLRVAL